MRPLARTKSALRFSGLVSTRTVMVHLAFVQSWISAGICHTDEYTRSGKDPEVRDPRIHNRSKQVAEMNVVDLPRASSPSFSDTRVVEL